MTNKPRKLSYHTSVDYALADPMKILAQKEGLATRANMPEGFTELDGTRGESAYVFSMGDSYGAFVQEGLGTKSLIAQAIYESTGVSYFAQIAQDTVACVINDLISVGATPVVLNAYWSAGSYDWLGDRELAEDFIKGWRKACDMAGVVWGGGETQSLSGIVMPGALEFAGSAFGIVRTERQLMRGARLRAGDTIVLIESSGVHANGISLIRAVADKLPDGYRTELPSGISLGESLLTPTHIYAQLMKRLFEAGLDIHYVSNITGHGWRKLMRAVEPFTYTIERIPPAGELFDFIAEQSGSDMHDMYGTFNMGAGFAIYAAAGAVSQIIQVAEAIGLRAWEVGHLEKGPKQVVIKPLDITFGSDSLEVR